MTGCFSVEEVENVSDAITGPIMTSWKRRSTSACAVGAVWHLNAQFHEGDGPPEGDKPIPRDDFVLGDLEGESCDPVSSTEFVAATLAASGHTVRLNSYPFKGAELVHAFSRPPARRSATRPCRRINRGLLYCDLKTGSEKTDGASDAA